MIDFEAFFRLSYGLYIVSTGDENNPYGFIANSVFQVTAEPPQFAACCNKDNFSAAKIEEYEHFSISVLKKDADINLIRSFGYKSGKNVDKFTNLSFHIGSSGTPIVTSECVAVIECKLVHTFDAGTHLIFVGETVSAELINESEEPLTYEYFRKNMKGFAPKNAPTFIDRKNLKPKKNT